MTQQDDMTSRPPGEDAGLAGLSAGPGSASAPDGPPGAEPPAPWFPSPYLAEGQAAPEAYPAPARPGQPRYGTSPAPFQGQQPGVPQPGYGREPAAPGPFGQPRQARQRGPARRAAQPRDPSLATGWERLLASTLDWMLILGVSFLVLHTDLLRLYHQLQTLVANAQYVSSAASQTALAQFMQRPSTLSVLLTYSLVVYGVALAYFWIMQATTAASVGKLLLGLRVVSAADRTGAGIKAAGLRTVAFLIGPAMFTFASKLGGTASGLLSLVGAIIWIADCFVLLNDPQRRSMHDRIAGTLVVRKASLRRSRTSL